MSTVSKEDSSCFISWSLWLSITVAWWVFAFYPVHARTPDWVLRTQYVCFGSMPNGLPAPEGWIMLTAAPLLLAISIAFLFPKGSRNVFRSSLARVIALIAIGSLGMWITPRIRDAEASPFAAELLSERSEESALPSVYPKIRKVVPAFSLVDHHGKSAQVGDFRDKVTLLTFIYAHCTTVCPALTTQAKEILSKISDPRFQVVLVTLDPWRDTPSSLPSLVEQWGLKNDRLRFLSGEPTEVHRFLETLGVMSSRDAKNGEITHAPLVAVLDRAGSIRYWFNRAPAQWIQDASSELLQ